MRVGTFCCLETLEEIHSENSWWEEELCESRSREMVGEWKKMSFAEEIPCKQK